MASTDIMIDMPCYHAILRVCAQARHVGRALDVLQQMIEQNLVPTDTTWKLLLWSAASDPVAAESIWKRGMANAGEQQRWTPSVPSLQALLVAYHTAGETAKIAKVYRDIVEQRNEEGMGMDRVILSQIEASWKVMNIFYEACKIHDISSAESISRLERLQFLPNGSDDYRYPGEG
jgi:pentatricopeptide repeat protein